MRDRKGFETFPNAANGRKRAKWILNGILVYDGTHLSILDGSSRVGHRVRGARLTLPNPTNEAPLKCHARKPMTPPGSVSGLVMIIHGWP